MTLLNGIKTQIRSGLPPSRYTPSGNIGIELELEGALPDDLPGGAGLYWNVVPEGSLRGGWEYVLRKPLPPSDAKTAINKLLETFKEFSPVTSIRTSTHYHVSVMDYTHEQVYQIVSLYYLLEEVLVRTQPETRQANLFTLRMSDAEGLFDGLIRSIELSSFFGMFSLPLFKYGACNLASPCRLGSLEFRFLQAYTTEADLVRWMDIFGSIVSYGASKTIAEILSEYDSISTKEFLVKIFGESNGEYLLSFYPSQYGVNRLLQTNYDNIVSLHNALTGRKFQLPENYWREDLIPDGPSFDDLYAGSTGTSTSIGGSIWWADDVGEGTFGHSFQNTVQTGP